MSTVVGKLLRINIFIPKLLNNLLASCSLKNHTLHILMKALFFPFCLYNFWIFTFYISLHFAQYDNIVL